MGKVWTATGTWHGKRVVGNFIAINAENAVNLLEQTYPGVTDASAARPRCIRQRGNAMTVSTGS